MVQIGVLSAFRREAMAARTCAELDGRGNARISLIRSRTLYYSGPFNGRSPDVPPGWGIIAWNGPNGGGKDFRKMVGVLDPDYDAILFEDDVQPCVNAVQRMAEITVPDDCGAVSYYDAGDTVGHLYAGMRTGLHKVQASINGDLGFHGAQALRLPAWLIRRMQAGEFDPPHAGQDVWVGRLVHRLGLKIAVTCPSLVQHVGDDSLCHPGSGLDGARKPADNFPGEDFDAMGEFPEVITPGTWTTREDLRITWCAFHGRHHDNAVACPMVL